MSDPAPTSSPTPAGPSAPDAPLGRRRTTRRSVHLMDRLSTAVISTGGLLVIVAVLAILVYLANVSLAVFRPGSLGRPVDTRLDPKLASDVLYMALDEQHSSVLLLSRDGVLRQVEAATGKVASEKAVAAPGVPITAFTRAPQGGSVGIGYADGRVQLGTLGFETDYLLDAESERALGQLAVGATTVYQGAVVSRTPMGQLRRVRVSSDLPEPVFPGEAPAEGETRGAPSPVHALNDYRGSTSEFSAVVLADGRAYFTEVSKNEPLGGGPATLSLTPHPVKLAAPAGAGLPDGVFVTADGKNLIVYWREGTAQRYDTSRPDDVALMETVRLTEAGTRIGVAAPLLGSQTLIVGDDKGGVGGWFPARDVAVEARDKLRLVKGHEFDPLAGAVAAVATSGRSRVFATVDALGSMVLRHMTSERTVARGSTSDLGALSALSIAPKADAVGALSKSGTLRVWELDPAHAEASVSSLFGKVWYEGEPGPAHVYQSSAGDDASEPKFGLTPLVFGTVKATVYTLLLAVPTGILAALATSEFLDKRVRTAVKPMIEMMASLPSVVLGFVAAMVIAPFVESWLAGVLLAFVVVPLGVLLAALVWQLLPMTILLSVSELRRGVAVAAVTLVSLAGALACGGALERALFTPGERDLLVLAGSYAEVPRERWPAWIGARTELTGRQERTLRAQGFGWRAGKVVEATGSTTDPKVAHEIERYRLDRPSLRRWLEGSFGSAWPGWAVITFPGAVVLVFVGLGRVFPAVARALDVGATQMSAGIAELARYGVGLALAGGLSAAAATVLSGAGLDPRDSIFGSFQQRNTLVVAIAMSVAVIPIIYTICEDAMTSVPDTLRSASLAAGATRWQTAVNIVLPVALSGVFSAVMIGLGRAAGETMIVLMATGNTPITSWSLFDGMRTLAANIAVELPEAAKNGTHFRLLFLCGLVLFVITFIFNTLAEKVRQRVRRRSAQL
jgi:phosphate transport system permease protein